jgi:hypothetical protein
MSERQAGDGIIGHRDGEAPDVERLSNGDMEHNRYAYIAAAMVMTADNPFVEWTDAAIDYHGVPDRVKLLTYLSAHGVTVEPGVGGWRVIRGIGGTFAPDKPLRDRVVDDVRETLAAVPHPGDGDGSDVEHNEAVAAWREARARNVAAVILGNFVVTAPAVGKGD